MNPRQALKLKTQSHNRRGNRLTGAIELIAYTETQKSKVFNETVKDTGHFSIQILIGENCPD